MKDVRYHRIDMKTTLGERCLPFRVKVLVSIVIVQLVIIILLQSRGPPEISEAQRVEVVYQTCTKTFVPVDCGAPAPQYELLRRRVEDNINELWHFVKAEATMSDESLGLLAEHKTSLLSDMDKMRENDGHDEWRENEILELSEIVQKRIHHIQNPSDCELARKVACKLDKCGYGCQVHQLGICLLMSYATGRTMVVEEVDQVEYGQQPWSDFFLPFSSCNTTAGKTHAKWGPQHTDPQDPVQVLHVPVTNQIVPKPDYLLTVAIPEDLSHRLIRVHEDPSVWWLGQFMKYLLRPQPATQVLVDERMEKSQLKAGPIVGIHVRRTDKVTSKEAKFHGLEEYMSAVDEYYNNLYMRDPGTTIKRRVYIASDDPKVITEAKEKYPHYEVLGDQKVVATVQKGRFTTAGLYGIILDTTLLSHCDYIVCTLSSNVCRLIYELRTALRPLTPHPVLSVDSNYLLMEPVRRYRQSVLPHKGAVGNSSDLLPGELVVDKSLYSDRGHGLVAGYRANAKEMGRFPAFKLQNYVSVGGFPDLTND